MSNNRAIGIYDSGLGGLTVWRAVRELLPAESIIYLGDGKNCPYGSRSKTEIERLADAAVSTLIDLGCKMVVVACNTATAAAIDFLRYKYKNIPIVGMEPAVKPACQSTKSRVVGVLATARSFEGDLFQRTVARYAHDVEIVTVVGEGFVEIVEQSREHTPEAERCVRAVVEPMLDRGVDQIVLGCTHYPFLMPVFERVIAGRDVAVIDPSSAVARRVKQLLGELSLRASEDHAPEYEFITYADDLYRERLKNKAFSQ